MTVFLGIDGGGSGCRAIVARREGPALGRGEAGPANIMTDPDGALANLVAAARAAIAGTGVRLGALHAVIGLAGANTSDRIAASAAALPFASTRLVSDTAIAIRGALGDGDGIVAMIGTGSAFGAQVGGAVEVIGGWGLILGDEASGAWIGRALLTRALRARDGLFAMTPLLRATLDAAGGPEALVAFAKAARPEQFGRYAPRVLAQSGDPAAQEILASAERWISRYVDRLSDGRALPIAFQGGLGPAFADRLAPRYPGRVVAPLGTPLDGALAMARQGGQDV